MPNKTQSHTFLTRLLSAISHYCSLSFALIRHRRPSPSVTLLLTVLVLLHAILILPGPAPALPALDSPPPAVLAQQWRARRFIFCASPGRAGSMHIRNVLRAARAAIALHEPAPRMHGPDLRDVLMRGLRESTHAARAEAKLRGIYRALAGTAVHVTYAETSHMFVKTFADVVLAEIAPAVANVTVVVLHRDLRDVVWSQLRLGWFRPGHSGMGVWYYGVENVHKSERVLPEGMDFGEGDFVEGGDGGVEDDRRRVRKLFGYNADVAARTKALQDYVSREQADGRLMNVNFAHYYLGESGDDDDDAEKIAEDAAHFLASIGIEPDMGRLAALGAQDINARDAKKSRAPSNILKREESDALVSSLLDSVKSLNLFRAE